MWSQPEEKPGLTHPPTGVHTCGQLTVFKAFFGLGTGTPPKATNQQKFVTRPAWTARVGVSAAFGIGLDDGKDRGQLWSDLIPSTSLGDCHALDVPPAAEREMVRPGGADLASECFFRIGRILRLLLETPGVILVGDLRRHRTPARRETDRWNAGLFSAARRPFAEAGGLEGVSRLCRQAAGTAREAAFRISAGRTALRRSQSNQRGHGCTRGSGPRCSSAGWMNCFATCGRAG
jgi:hypothetical protein